MLQKILQKLCNNTSKDLIRRLLKQHETPCQLNASVQEHLFLKQWLRLYKAAKTKESTIGVGAKHNNLSLLFSWKLNVIVLKL